MKSISIFLVTLLCACTFAVAQTPVLDVTGGKITGSITELPGVMVYKGIPYAAPPVGELRWKKPQPVRAWKGVRECNQFGAACFQPGSGEGSFYWREFYQGVKPQFSEDCLYLNVWTPAAGTDARLPVVLWIHGGAYHNGYGHEIEFDGEAYAKKDVILVTINYRLGMWGFLAHPLLTAENGGKGSGNYGLYDQLEALRWVKKNIAAFGGNPDNVTVMGQSAGAGSVQALISSPLSKGLIHRAVIQSGGGLGSSFRSLQEAEQRGEAIWKEAGITSLKEMRAYPADKFLELLAKQKNPGGSPYAPCIDGELLTAPLEETAKTGKELDISYMIGYTSDDFGPDRRKQAAVGWSLLQEKQNRQPAYVYCFSHDLPGEELPPDPKTGKSDEMKGAFHSSELWYMFGTLGKSWRPMEAADYELSERMVSYWTNFARTGNPNGEGLPVWKPCTEKDAYVQILDVKK